MSRYFNWILIIVPFLHVQLSAGSSRCLPLELPLLAKIPVQEASLVCKDRAKWLLEKISISKSFFEVQISEEVDLVLLGEAHFTPACYEYASIFENLKKNEGVNCLFLEFNKWVFSEVVLTADSQSPVKCFRELVEKVQKTKINIFPVDKDGVENRRDYYLTTKGLNERDKHMEEEILKRKSECSRSIVIVGKEHISSMKPGRNNLSERLKNKYRMETLNLQNTKNLLPPFEGEKDISWTYNGLCTPPEIQTEKIRIFENGKVPAYMDILPGEGSWGDFNKTILIQ